METSRTFSTVLGSYREKRQNLLTNSIVSKNLNLGTFTFILHRIISVAHPSGYYGLWIFYIINYSLFVITVI
jgi:hypothetical protein